jgi:hypothetical protein
MCCIFCTNVYGSQNNSAMCYSSSGLPVRLDCRFRVLCTVSQEHSGALILALLHVAKDGDKEGEMSRAKNAFFCLCLLHFLGSAGKFGKCGEHADSLRFGKQNGGAQVCTRVAVFIPVYIMCNVMLITIISVYFESSVHNQ